MGREGVLAVDIGTSGARAAILSRDAVTLGFAESHYGFDWCESTGFAEQDPEAVFVGVMSAIGRCCADAGASILRVTVASAMHSLMLLDEHRRALSPLSIWMDRRAQRQCEEYRDVYQKGEWHARTGCLLSASYPLARLLWYRQNDPQLFSRFWKALSIKSYVHMRLTGVCVEDHSVASGVGALNVHRRLWDSDVLASASLTARRLPELLPVEEAFYRGAPHGLQAVGIDEDTVWIAGGADGPLTHLASVGNCSTAASLSIGTSAAVRFSPDSVTQLESAPTIWCYVLDAHRHVVGRASNNGGCVLDWCVRALFPGGITLGELDARLMGVRPDPSLLFIPYLYGERDEFIATHPAAGFVGLRPEHGALELLLSSVEGVVFGVALMLEELRACGELVRIVVSGGATRLCSVRRVLSAVVEGAEFLQDEAGGTLRGAGILAWAGLGVALPCVRGQIDGQCEDTVRSRYLAKYEMWKQAVAHWSRGCF